MKQKNNNYDYLTIASDTQTVTIDKKRESQ